VKRERSNVHGNQSSLHSSVDRAPCVPVFGRADSNSVGDADFSTNFILIFFHFTSEFKIQHDLSLYVTIYDVYTVTCIYAQDKVKCVLVA